jgi:IS605 OrfB family transposase
MSGMGRMSLSEPDRRQLLAITRSRTAEVAQARRAKFDLMLEAGESRDAANQRYDFYHKQTTWLVQTFGHIITEDLSVSTMLMHASKGSGLKRGVSDAAWATGIVDKLKYKAEEAGARLGQVPTRIVKPTRRC